MPHVTPTRAPAQWPGTSAHIPGEAAAELLAVAGSELSRQGCLVIDRVSWYFDMVPETHAHILVHAMLLWNACVRAGTAFGTDVLSFVLVPVACFQIAAKFCGGHNCIEPTPACLAPVALSIAELMFDAPHTQDYRKTKAAVLAAELRVLQTLDFNVCMSEAVALALELIVKTAG
jgi:hypothetical protein